MTLWHFFPGVGGGALYLSSNLYKNDSIGYFLHLFLHGLLQYHSFLGEVLDF